LELFPPQVSRKLLTLADERIHDMDAAGIIVQVISHNPGAGALPLHMCRQANDQLFAEGTARRKQRLAGFAALPMNSPLEAAEELSRCVKELGFVGTLISNHADGQYFDDEAYWPVFETAQSLDVPVYLHPTFPKESKRASFEGNFDRAATEAMSAYAWGWHSDVGLHFLRLFASGLFDRCPRLKIVLGHMGEMTPFMIERVQRFSGRWAHRQRPLMTVWAENVWFTTSGMFTLGPLACLLRTVSVEKILFSVDYPFEDNQAGRRFIEEVRESGLLTTEQVEMMAYRNAEKLLRIQACLTGQVDRSTSL
jgi:predicted TIM-barrel fold metal-dependent hydrolase